MSKPDVMLSFGVMYLYVSKKKNQHDSQNLQQLKSCQYINLFYFKKKSIYLFIYLFIHLFIMGTFIDSTHMKL